MLQSANFRHHRSFFESQSLPYFFGPFLPHFSMNLGLCSSIFSWFMLDFLRDGSETKHQFWLSINPKQNKPRSSQLCFFHFTGGSRQVTTQLTSSLTSEPPSRGWTLHLKIPVGDRHLQPSNSGCNC